MLKGTFDYVLNCEIIDKMADVHNPLVVYDRGISSIPVQLFGQAVSITTIAVPKYSGGKLFLILKIQDLNHLT